MEDTICYLASTESMKINSDTNFSIPTANYLSSSLPLFPIPRILLVSLAFWTFLRLMCYKICVMVSNVPSERRSLRFEDRPHTHTPTCSSAGFPGKQAREGEIWPYRLKGASRNALSTTRYYCPSNLLESPWGRGLVKVHRIDYCL